MGRLEDTSAEELREHLDTLDGTRTILRLIVGINYKEGISQSELADWYGVSRTTIHNWIARLEEFEGQSIEEVLYDAKRSGRPTKLTNEQMERVEQVIRNPPEEVGLDANRWGPMVMEQFLETEFDVSYSRRHLRSILKDIRDDVDRK